MNNSKFCNTYINDKRYIFMLSFLNLRGALSAATSAVFFFAIFLVNIVSSKYYQLQPCVSSKCKQIYTFSNPEAELALLNAINIQEIQHD